MTEAAIRIENLTRDFETVRALDGLSLEVASSPADRSVESVSSFS